MHEVGHVLGLTWSKNAYSHCSDKSCLMYRTYSVNSNKNKTKHLCDACKNCLKTAIFEEADPRLSFVGPVMVRAEKDYQVLALPGFVKLHFGPLETVNWKNLLEEACNQVPQLAPRPGSVAVTMNPLEPGGLKATQRERAIEIAKGDPCATVRLGITAIDRRPRRPLAQFKSSGDFLSKLY